jgi:murein L,D-transpeptidase YcbB/YkuD
MRDFFSKCLPYLQGRNQFKDAVMKLNMVLLTVVVMSFSATASSSMLQRLGWVSSSEQLNALNYPATIELLYEEIHHQLVWLDPTLADELEARLEIIHLAGISKEFSSLYLSMQEAKQNHQYYRYELLATDAFLRYLSYTHHARNNAEQWFHGGQVSRKLPSISDRELDQVIDAIRSDQLLAFIGRTHPANTIYKTNVPVIEQLKVISNSQGLEKRFNQFLRRGTQINDPQLLAKKLSASGIVVPAKLTTHPDYDWQWQQQVKQFQSLHGLKADGIVGEQTLYWINYPAAQKIRVLALNIERSRGFSTQKRAYIQVNLPQYKMKFWANNQLQFETRVIVGKEERPTPLMWTSLSTIVVNPTWNIPIKIMRKDLLPKVAKNSQYLVDQNISIIPYWGSDRVIDSSSINWSSVNAETFNYRMTQSSGSHNALGQYKFLLPNDRAIYLHDTPAKGLFSRSERAFSSGCVRVQGADKFAQTLLEVSGQSKSPLFSGDSNKKVRMKRGIPVEFIYRSAWVEKGQLHMRKDIYGYDDTSRLFDLAMN